MLFLGGVGQLRLDTNLKHQCLTTGKDFITSGSYILLHWSYTTKIQYPVLIMLGCVCFSNFLYCWVLQNFVSLHKHAISYTHTSNWKVLKYCILFCLGVWQVSFSFWPQTLKQSVRVTAFGRGLLFRFVCAPTPVLHDSVFIVGSQLSE